MASSRNRYFWLVASHLAAFGLAWVVSRSETSRIESSSDAPVRTKSANRNSHSSAAGDGARLLAGFMEAANTKKSPYQELKGSLPVAADPKSAFESATEAYLSRESPDENECAELEVSAYQWMKQNPESGIDFLTADRKRLEILQLLGVHVIPDLLSEQGLMNCLGWVTKNRVTMNCVPAAALHEIKAGAGLPLYLKLEEALDPTGQSKATASSNYAWREFHRSAGKAVSFEERQSLLDCVMNQTDPAKQHDLLLGFSEGGQPAMEWVMNLIQREQLDLALAAKLRSALGNEVLNKPGMEMDMRVEARRATQGNENKDRQSIINEIVGGDVKQLLINGRDWRYEFRTGVSSLEDVLTAVREGLPQVPPEGESALLVSLYRQLSEENPGKALPLLDSLPEEKRREILFSNTWEAYGGNNPDDYVRFLNSLPEPVTEKEKAERIKGWDWKARLHLSRYGDDYVDWVIQLPPGLDRDRAMNSLVWATREQDPAKARELEARLYPKKP